MSVSLVALARAWLVVATTSFGGGPASLLLARRELVEKRGWLTQRQFLEDYALSKMGLGINLITMSGLVGTRIAGRRGMIVSIVSFVVPAALITIALTAAYLQVRDSPLVRGAIDLAFAVLAFVVAYALTASPLVLIPLGAVVGVTFLRGEPARVSGEAA